MVHTTDLHFQQIDKAIAAYIVPTSSGPVLIESGPYSTWPALTAALQKLGYKVGDLQAVLLSHIHFDHAGAAWALAKEGVPVYVHPKGAKHLASPERLYGSAKRIYGDMMEKLWGIMEPIDPALLHSPADGETVTIGDTTFTAHHTPGHAVHHIAWQMGDAIFAGDVAGVKIEEGPVQPPCPPPDINIEDWTASIDKLLALQPATLYLTHYGAITEVVPHLQQLKEELRVWAEWMHPHWEAQADQQALVPQFAAFVEGRLSAAGLGKADIKVYEAANPAGMSVAGLMRYWQKRSEKNG